MIEFNANKKKLSEYITEMGVRFGQGETREPFEDYRDFLSTIAKSNIKSSSMVEYDNQENEWRKLANNCGYDGLKDMAAAIVKLTDAGDLEEGFDGLEGLAVEAANKELMAASDYANVGSGDQLLVSMFYGGNRMKQWKKYAKPYIKANIFIEELKNWDQYGLAENENMRIEFTSPTSAIIYFNQGINVNQTNDEAKKRFHRALENGDELFDFTIVEEFESDKWTLKVK